MPPKGPPRASSPKPGSAPKKTDKKPDKDKTREKSKDRDNPELDLQPSQAPQTGASDCDQIDFSNLSDLNVKRLMLHQLCSIAKSLRTLTTQQNFTNIYTNNPCYTGSTYT
nr:ORF-4 [Hypera postica associated alphaflexivirus]